MVLSGRLPPAAMFPAGRPELRTRYLELASGLRVRAVESGDSSAPLVLFVPGWGCSAYVFRENFAPLAEAGYHAVAVELKGHGLSDKPVSPREYRLEPMRQHVAEILDALGEPAIICGLSMGASLGSHLAASSPGRVRGLVMVSPVGFSGVPGLTAVRLATGSVVAPILPRITGRWVIKLLLAFVNGRLRQTTKRDVEEYWAPTQFPEFTLAMRHLLHEFTWDASFIPPDVPSLLMCGTRDRFLSGAGLSRLRRMMPKMRCLEIENAGHVVCDEAPAIVNQELLDFFEKLI